ncbi:MAG: hypothetical protein ACLQLE_08510, partial [Desulfobaccales bacterium]
AAPTSPTINKRMVAQASRLGLMKGEHCSPVRKTKEMVGSAHPTLTITISIRIVLFGNRKVPRGIRRL